MSTNTLPRNGSAVLDVDTDLAALLAIEAALPFTPSADLALAVAEAAAAGAEFGERFGTVYLLHFDRPYGHAAHYCGWTADLAARLAEHATGRGARLLAVVRAAGISWQLARTWPGDRTRERALKRQGGASRRCPLCGVRPRCPDAGRAA
jgi:predicted GIY-YIG superfamily endonuclease